MSRLRSLVLPAVLLCAGAVLMLLGLFSSEAAVILRKAILICLECIGIG